MSSPSGERETTSFWRWWHTPINLREGRITISVMSHHLETTYAHGQGLTMSVVQEIVENATR